MTALLVADSFLVDDGRVRGLSLHRARFTASCSAHGIDAGGFFDAVIAELPREGRWFPRLELTDKDLELGTGAERGLRTGAELGLATGTEFELRIGAQPEVGIGREPPLAGRVELGWRLRPAPEYGGPVAVLPYDRPDPRRQPRVKGPDLELLGALRDRAAASDGAGEVLLCGRAGEVLEGAYTSLLWWEDDVLCLPPADLLVLPSVTVSLLRGVAAERGVEVAERRRTIAELDGREAWLVNALHGIRPVRAWLGSGPSPGAAVHAAEWQRLLTDLAEPLPA